LGLNKDQREDVCNDVQQRLGSLLAHWADDRFRRTILTLGLEEAAFWVPATASLEIRALVVVAVRNSLIENLNAQPGSRKQSLSDDDMPYLTGEAVEYFQKADLSQSARVAPSDDVFGALPRRFPNAWQCLSALANVSTGESHYVLSKEKAEPVGGPAIKASSSRIVTVSSSGIDSRIDSELARLMGLVQSGELTVFFSPSFARITRHPAKLLAIVDHLLRHGASLVTSNHLLTDSYVARRTPLIRPAHTHSEVMANLENMKGLTVRHREVLETVIES